MSSDYLLDYLLTKYRIKHTGLKKWDLLFNASGVDKTSVLVSIKEWLETHRDKLKDCPEFTNTNLKPIVLHELLMAGITDTIAEILHAESGSSFTALEIAMHAYFCYGKDTQSEQLYCRFFHENNDALLKTVENSITKTRNFLAICSVRFFNENSLNALNKKLMNLNETLDRLPKELIFVIKHLHKEIALSLLKGILSSRESTAEFKGFIKTLSYSYCNFINQMIPIEIPDNVVQELTVNQTRRLLDLITDILYTEISNLKLSKALFKFNFTAVNKKYIATLLAKPNMKDEYQKIKASYQLMEYFLENNPWAKFIEKTGIDKHNQWHRNYDTIHWIIHSIAKNSKLSPHKKAVLAKIVLKTKGESIYPAGFRELTVSSNISNQEIEDFVRMIRNVESVSRNGLRRSYQPELI